MTTQHPEVEWLDKVLTDFRSSTIIIHAQGSVRGPEEDRRAFQQSLHEAKSQIEAKLKEEVKNGMLRQRAFDERKLKSAEERAYKQGWDSAGGEVMEETHQKELKSAEIEGRIDERKFTSKLINDIRYQNITLDFANKLADERLATLETDQELAQLKTIKEAE